VNEVGNLQAMGLRTSRQAQRWARGILRVTLNVLLAASIAFTLHILLRGKSKSWNGHDTGLQLPPHDTVEPLSTIEVAESQQHPDENATLWQVMLQDPTLQGYVNLNMPFGDIKGHLDNASEIYTVYAPINSAFEGPLRHPVDAPEFYYKFISLNHMGPNNVSFEEMKASTTVENFINHDIFFKNLQRISTKSKNGGMVLNHVANYVGRPLVRNEICEYRSSHHGLTISKASNQRIRPSYRFAALFAGRRFRLAAL